MYRNRSVEEFFRSLSNGKDAVSVDDLSAVELSGLDENKDCELDEAGIYTAKAPANAPVAMSWENLTVKTKAKNGIQKTLLKGISGTITGGLWGIMGASGSGKTTFLSCLSIRLDTQRMEMSGSIVINGKPYEKALLKGMSGYVMQDDLIHAQLTVMETLRYTAALRMGLKFTKQEREARCEEVLLTMGIDYCRDVIVGDSRNKGISGGERKRLCIAMELLTKPKLLFLDEPTSGLDSSTALSVMSTLKSLADKGECTVVCTIHQPQTKIFNIIDNLLLMKKGQIVYQGACALAADYFAKAGYPCPDKMNPADHLLDVVTVGAHDKDVEEAHVKILTPYLNMDFGLEKNDFTLRAINPWFFQFYTLACRSVQEKVRRWDIFAMNIFITCIVAVFVSMGGWYNIGIAQDSIAKRNGILFFAVIHQGVVSSLQGTYAFPMERALMLRERASGSYYVSAYFLSKTTVELAMQVCNPVFYSLFVVYLCGLQSTSQKFGVFLGLNMLLSVSATSLSNMISCLCVNIEMSTVVLSCFMELSRLYSAFFVSPLLLDSLSGGHWKFADALSYMKWAYVGLCLNEYQGLQYSCAKSSTVSTPVAACIKKGEQTMALFGYEQYTIDYCVGILIVYIFGCRLFSYLALRFIKV